MAPEPGDAPKAHNKTKGGTSAASRAPTTTKAGKSKEGKSTSKVATAKSKSAKSGRSSGSREGRGATSGREISKLGTDTKKTSARENKCDIKLTKEMSRQLTANEWYHGMMPREEIEELLVNEGDFLVRKTEVGGKSKISLGVLYHGSPRHFLFEYENDEWSLKSVKKKSLAELVEHLVENKTPLHGDGCAIVTPVPRPDYYILHEDVDIKQKLGRGAFGDVHIGVIKRGNEEVKVAVKKLRGMIGKKQQKEFLKESRIMRRCDHRNVIRLIGVAVQEEPVLIVLELAEDGALNDFLKKNPETPKEKLSEFARDACRGMTYLAGRDIIHRDLAARNCLIGKNAKGGSVAKISDFGLSVSDTDIVKLKQLRCIPVKWCAPETLTKAVYTTKTDVWSFGVLMWEIFTRCSGDPYGPINNHDAKAKIVAGEVLETPQGMPRLIANAMELCFTQSAEERPEFEVIFRIIAPKEQPPPPDHKFRTY